MGISMTPPQREDSNPDLSPRRSSVVRDRGEDVVVDGNDGGTSGRTSSKNANDRPRHHRQRAGAGGDDVEDDEEELVAAVENVGGGGLTVNDDGSTSSSADDDDGEQSDEGDEGVHGAAAAAGYYFLSTKAREQIPQYRYNGQDLSLLYKYVLSPLAQFCVDNLTPRWLAPNSITLIGLCFMVSSYSIIWYYVPDLVPYNYDEEEGQEGPEPPPRWIFFWNAACMLLYQTLDNMDGKQARRTESSSSLGLLFDHGVDALNSVIGSANWIVAMALHPRSDGLACWILLFGPYALFYITTWEEYYTGKLVMPIVNGPNEGLVGGALMSLTSWYCGPAYWQQRTWWDTLVKPLLAMILPSSSSWLSPDFVVRNADLLILASSIGFVQETALKIVGVARQHGIGVALTLLPFATLAICSLSIGSWTALDEDDDSSSSLWISMPRTCLHLCAILFVEMTTALMLAHVSNEFYTSFRWTLLPLVVLAFLMALPGSLDSSGFLFFFSSPQEYLIAYTYGAAVFLIMKTAVIIHEISSLLGIWCFDIVTPRRQRRGQQRKDAHHHGGTKFANGRFQQYRVVKLE